ncbi:hypothetical protein [Bacillus sp. 2205SS5-2]|uniref:hypothetical protein n=1 Tax=Bacillus sp. 2205SS5-2 TaxID=3109031 RepID=UPI0030061AF0
MSVRNVERVINKSVVTLCILLLVILFSPEVSQAKETQKGIKLGLHYEVLVDPTNDITIEDLLTGKYDENFVPSESEYQYFGYTFDTI